MVPSYVEAVRASTAWPGYGDRRSRHDRAVRASTAWPVPRAISRLPLVVSFVVAAFCTACGQTGPLTLDRPVDAASAPAAEPAVVEPNVPNVPNQSDVPDERDQSDEPGRSDEPDERASDGGAGDAGER